MNIDANQAALMLSLLCSQSNFAQTPVTNRPETDLWRIYDTCLLNIRLPLYYRRLGKKPPKPALRAAAIQACLAVVAAFAHAHNTRQVLVTAHGQWISSVSFQPRPAGMNWTAQYAIDPPEAVRRASSNSAPVVTLEDMLHFAAKTACAIAGYPAGEIAHGFTATFSFDPNAPMNCQVVVREQSGNLIRTGLRT